MSQQKKTASPCETIRMPHDWKNDFRNFTFRTVFNLSLSQPMIEMICAIADGVHWDRSNLRGDIHRPDNPWAPGAALMKRGLIRLSTPEERKKMKGWSDPANATGEWSAFALTPAGQKIVELFKVTGIFVEADNAITKKFRKG